jgi:hypothetical protein
LQLFVAAEWHMFACSLGQLRTDLVAAHQVVALWLKAAHSVPAACVAAALLLQPQAAEA